MSHNPSISGTNNHPFGIQTGIAVIYRNKSKTARRSQRSNLIDTAELVYLSIVSLWGIAIKINVGKLQITASVSQLLIRLEFLNVEILPINTEDSENFDTYSLN